MMMRMLCVLAVVFAMRTPVSAQPLEGDYLYRVTTVRAAPGKLEALIDWTTAMKESDYFKDAGEFPPLIMRHSQGDQWDLLKITPMESWQAYYSKRRTSVREKADATHLDKLQSGFSLVAFEEDHFAYGPPLETVVEEFDSHGFFHIEMFEAAPGRTGELIEQRRMENAYLAATGQKPNMIFTRAAGSDVDAFTIGFHESFEAFATQGPASSEAAEVAAQSAGFKSRADISYFLRSLISGHYDTLAVKAE
ncbi:MAG: hypothetical protein AAGD92_09540 [Pseudomonadota bacterium]